jgi:hypothetical protein
MFFLDIVRDTLLLNYTEHAFEFPNCVEASISIDSESEPDVSYSVLFTVDSRSLRVEKAQAFDKFENRLTDITEKWREIPTIRKKIEEIENAINR